MSSEKLAEHWIVRYGEDKKSLPIKTLQYNRCPSIAPIAVLNDQNKKTIGYDNSFDLNLEKLKANPEFIVKISDALDIIENQQQTQFALGDDVDTQLYDGFWNDTDRGELNVIRHSDVEEFSELQQKIKNKRLREMMPLYKARNFPQKLTPEEHDWWEARKRKTMLDGGDKSKLAKVFNRMQEIAKTRKLSSKDEYLLSELQLYIESIVPEPEN